MVSTIDPTIPADGILVYKSSLRANFTAAYNDIGTLQLNLANSLNYPVITTTLTPGLASSRYLAGTSGQIALTDGGTQNPLTLSLVSNTIIPGTGSIQIPSGTTAQRTFPGVTANFRYNTSLSALEFYNGAAWFQLGTSVAINTLNTLVATTQTFATGTTGSDFNISSATSTHTFNIPDASATNRGVVTTGTQTLAGDKTFSGTIAFSGSTSFTTLRASVVANQIILGTTNTTTLSATAPALSSTYTIPDVGATANFVMTAGNQSVSGVKSFTSAGSFAGALTLSPVTNQLVLGVTNTTTITSPAPVASRVYTIPDAGTNSSFMMLNGTQTVAGATTFTLGTTFSSTGSFASALTLLPTTNQLVLGVTNTTTINSVAPAAPRTYTIPDAGTNSSFMMLDGAQTILGAKTFNNASAITLGSGVFQSQAGSVSAPGFTITGSTGTGLYSSGANNLDVTSNGTNTINMQSTATKFLAQGYFAEATLTDGTNIAWAVGSAQAATVTLGGNRTLSNATGVVAGGNYLLRVVQDGSGGRTLAYGTNYKFGTNGTPVLSTGIGATDILLFYSNGSLMYCVGIVQGF